MIGIAGGSGSGKTTIAAAVAATIPGVVIIQHDAYYRHRPDLEFEQRSAVNYDHPDSLETELLIGHLAQLRLGHSVELPTYDFSRHLRSEETRRVEASRVTVVEGILVLADAALRRELDLKLFVDTDPDVRLARRIERDLEERGRSVDSVLTQYFATVRPMHLEFIEPSKRYADLIIPEGYNPNALSTVVDMIRSSLTGAPSIYSPA